MIAGNDILADVIANLELNSSTSNTDVIARFRIWDNINAAQVDIIKLFPANHVDNCIKTAKGNLVANTRLYQWPSDFVSFENLWIDFDNGISNTNPGYEATLPNNNIVYPASLDQQASKITPKWNHAEGGWELSPMPTAAKTNGYRLKYRYKLPTVSASQQSLLRDDLLSAIVTRATQYCALVDNYDPELASSMKDLFFDQLTAAKGE